MRGYRRRSGLSYLLGVGLASLLGIQIGGTLLQLGDVPWWGVYAGTDGVVRRVVEGSPGETAGIEKNDRVVSFGGYSWSRYQLARPAADGTLTVRLAAPDSTTRSVTLVRRPTPRPELLRQALFGFIALAFLLTGLVVFLSRSDTVATLFYLMCLLFARQVMPREVVASEEGLLASKMVLDLASLVLPSVVLHFFLLFPQRSRFLQRNPRRAWLLYVPAILSMPIAVRLDLDFVYGDRIPALAEPFQQATALVFVAMIIWGVVSFLRGVRGITSPLLRRSVRWVLPGTALGILPPLFLSALLNVFPDLEIPGDRYAFVTLVLVPLSFGHAIIRYGLLDLQLVVKRSVVFTALTAILVVGYWLVAELVAGIVGRNGTERTIVSFAVVFAAALLFVPARERIESFVEGTLYRRRFDYRRTLREFSSLFATFLEREELVRLLVERIPDVVGTGQAVLFLRTGRDDSLRVAGTLGVGPGEIALPLFHPSPELLRWWSEFEGPVPVGSARRAPERFDRLPAEERQLLDALDPRVIVFLPRERTLEGLLVLGRKIEGERYRAEDLELLATLGDQAGTALSSSRLHEEALERRRLEEELAVAKRIQASLLPASVPARDGVEIAAMTRPCHEVGGDFYDFLDFGEDGLGLAVADVSGKGVPAALILSGLQATLRAEANGATAPEPIVRKLNERLCSAVEAGNFASLLYGHLDLRRRAFRYVNAGHPAGLVVRRDGAVERLEAGGLLLGVERSAEYAGAERSLSPGDLLVLYSDGVTDVLNEADEEFGHERLEALLPRLAHLPSRGVIDSIVSAVESFVGGTLPDDLTLLVAKFRTSPAAVPPA